MADYPASVIARYEFRTHAPLPRLPSESTPSSPTFLLARRPSARWTAPPGRLHPHPWHPPSSSPTSTLRLPSCKTNSRPFFCSVVRIYIFYIYILCVHIYIYTYSAFLLRGGACSTPRKRRREAAVACSVGSAFWTTSGWTVCTWTVGQVGGCTRGWMGAWTTRRGGGLLGGMGTLVDVARSAPGFAGNFFSSEFSKGNDLRYISKGFLLVGKRVRRSAIHPPEGRLARSRGLPDNLHFSTINLTFVRLFFCGQSDWPYVREGLPPCPLSLVLEKSEAVECFQRRVIRWIDDTCLMERIFFLFVIIIVASWCRYFCAGYFNIRLCTTFWEMDETRGWYLTCWHGEIFVSWDIISRTRMSDSCQFKRKIIQRGSYPLIFYEAGTKYHTAVNLTSKVFIEESVLESRKGLGVLHDSAKRDMNYGK